MLRTPRPPHSAASPGLNTRLLALALGLATLATFAAPAVATAQAPAKKTVAPPSAAAIPATSGATNSIVPAPAQAVTGAAIAAQKIKLRVTYVYAAQGEKVAPDPRVARIARNLKGPFTGFGFVDEREATHALEDPMTIPLPDGLKGKVVVTPIEVFVKGKKTPKQHIRVKVKAPSTETVYSVTDGGTVVFVLDKQNYKTGKLIVVVTASLS